jgi:site-specific recombinase
VVDALTARSVTARRAEDFAERFALFATASGLAECNDAFASMAEWGRMIDEDGDRAVNERFLSMLEQSEELRNAFVDAIARIASDAGATELFGDAGIPSDRSFLVEALDRLMRHVLPEPRDDHNLAWLLGRMIQSRQSVAAFASIPQDRFLRLVRILMPDDRPNMWSRVRNSYGDGMRLLAARITAQGLDAPLRRRSHHSHVSTSPFFKLSRVVDDLLAARGATDDMRSALAAFRQTITKCRGEMAQIFRRLETDGVNVEIVYGLTVLKICLDRLENMVSILESPTVEDFAEKVHKLLVNLVEATRRDRSINDLVGTNVQMLHRRIVERSGETGEHYIAMSKREYRHIWLAAAGGGFLTAFTAAVKMVVTHSHLPLFVEGFLASLNYAGSFLLMQAFALILATKQPAMTAAALAKIIREGKGHERSEEIVEFLARISRSQLAAAISNVCVVFLTAYAFNALWRLASGHPFLDEHTAQDVFVTLSPTNSGTIFYAALTGVLLYLGSLAGGWLENWSMYHKIPQAIREGDAGNLVGRHRAKQAADFYTRNVAGWGTNIALGFLLGMTPAIGKFMGLPLDVRHVTLSTGMLALGAASLHFDLFNFAWFMRAVGGIGTMFVLNLSVAFTLSLLSAGRAYGLSGRELFDIVRTLGSHLRRSLREFILPPRDEPDTAGHH